MPVLCCEGEHYVYYTEQYKHILCSKEAQSLFFKARSKPALCSGGKHSLCLLRLLTDVLEKIFLNKGS